MGSERRKTPFSKKEANRLNGLIFDIQRFSVHDGPGVRTTVFCKGCPLRCGWCHNPEGLAPRAQLQFLEENCIHCGSCADACPSGVHSFAGGRHTVDFPRCTACGKCAGACPSGAVRLAGREISPREVLEAVRRDLPFYGEEGGVTFSGGECTMQPEFLLEALALCREAGIRTAVDTCGMAPAGIFRALLPLTGVFLYDIKAVTPETHRAGTGADNARILQNYRMLAKAGCRIWVRVPVVGGFNASEGEMEAIARFLAENPGAEQIELMPYHRLGSGKYAQIGLERPEDPGRMVSRAQMERYARIFKEHGLPVQAAERKNES